MDISRSLQCFMCRGACSCIIGFSDGKGHSWTFWRCPACSRNLIEVGEGIRVEIVVTDVEVGEFLRRTLSGTFDHAALEQLFTDSRIFHCPRCGGQLSEAGKHRVYITKQSEIEGRIRSVTVQAELQCTRRFCGPRTFTATYRRGNQHYTLEERAG
ncbi:MAG: hypothetical protein WC505_04955 [Patescibacteria group bacterium]